MLLGIETVPEEFTLNVRSLMCIDYAEEVELLLPDIFWLELSDVELLVWLLLLLVLLVVELLVEPVVKNVGTKMFTAGFAAIIVS